MAKAYDGAATRSYITLSDRSLPKTEQSTFTLGWLSIFDIAAIEEQFSKNPEAGAFPRLIEIVRRALRGWDNFPAGAPVAMEKGIDGLPTESAIKMIPPREVIELSRDCDAQERLAPDDVGKS